MGNDYRTAVACHLAMAAIADQAADQAQRARLERAAQGLREGTLTLRARVGNAYFVFSARSGREYCVIDVGGTLHCSCPDFQRRHVTCKHAYAVMMLQQKASERAKGEAGGLTL